MTVRSRAVILAALACAPLAFVSACGGENGNAAGSRSTLQYVPPTNYVLKEPATTTTTTTVAPSAGDGTRSPGEQTYVIKAGDGLFAIAQSFDVDMQVICDYNAWDRCGGDKLLLPGDEILIPPNAVVAAAVEADSDSSATSESDSIDTADDGAAATEGEGCLHTIVSGDNQGRVANQYNVTLDELAAANASNPVWNTFLIGSTINIPANGTCPD